MLYFEEQWKRWFKLVLVTEDTVFSWASIMNLFLWGGKQIHINTVWSGKASRSPFCWGFLVLHSPLL